MRQSHEGKWASSSDDGQSNPSVLRSQRRQQDNRHVQNPLSLNDKTRNLITNSSSINARLNFPGYSLYSASKAGIDSLNRTWAKELAIKYHCTVNAVLVGATATPDAPDSPARQGVKDMATAEKRLGTMEDVAEIVTWLASEGSRW